MSQLVRNEPGQALLGLILLMLVGSLTVTATLGLAHTSLRYGQTAENQVKRFYAADAGVEHGLWTIMTLDPGMVGSIPENTTNLTETINGMQVQVTLTPGTDNYTISANATDPSSGIYTSYTKYWVKVPPP